MSITRLNLPCWQTPRGSGPAGQLFLAVALAVMAAGCASKRPTPLVVQAAAGALPAKDPGANLGLKLVTYNIWGLPWWLNGARPSRYADIAHELERLDPDIILLQEAWTAKARKSAPRDGRWSIARGAGQHLIFQQNGLVTLSRFPIIGGAFYPFSHAAFPDRLVRKGALKVTLRLPGGQVLNVWNVHLQEGGPSQIRHSQIDELIAHVNEAEDGQIADLVGGDFNCTPECPSFRELETALGPSVLKLCGIRPFVTWDGLSSKPGAGQTLDYIFVRARMALEKMEAVAQVAFYARNRRDRLSDHFGVEAEVNLNPASVLASLLPPFSSSLGEVSKPRVSRYALGRSHTPDQNSVAGLELKGGLNTLIFKAVNEPLSWQDSIHDAGQPVKGISATLDSGKQELP
jgi:endonuclease/exonuclease/phosphatase family metal-dependent hydrolase